MLSDAPHGLLVKISYEEELKTRSLSSHFVSCTGPCASCIQRKGATYLPLPTNPTDDNARRDCFPTFPRHPCPPILTLSSSMIFAFASVRLKLGLTIVNFSRLIFGRSSAAETCPSLHDCTFGHSQAVAGDGHLEQHSQFPSILGTVLGKP